VLSSQVDQFRLPQRERSYRITGAWWNQSSGASASLAAIVVTDGAGNILSYHSGAANVGAGATMIQSFSTISLHALHTAPSGGAILQIPLPQDLMIIPGWQVTCHAFSTTNDALLSQISVTIDP
jgi:hypothetical protein